MRQRALQELQAKYLPKEEPELAALQTEIESLTKQLQSGNRRR